MPSRLIDLFKPSSYESFVRIQKARFLHITLQVVTGACLVSGLLNIGVKPSVAIFLLLVGGVSFG